MKALVFDSGPIISLALNNILYILKPLKKKLDGKFYVTSSVREELIDKPMRTKKFKFESIQAKEQFNQGVLEEVEAKKELIEMTERILFYANNSFQAWGSYIKILHDAEAQSLALTKIMGANALVVDERTTRMLIEDANGFARMMSKRLHTQIKVDKENLKKFQQMADGIKVIRSIELVTIAFEMKLFEKYHTDKKELLDALLWGVKLSGCSVKEEEINELLTIEQ